MKICEQMDELRNKYNKSFITVIKEKLFRKDMNCEGSNDKNVSKIQQNTNRSTKIPQYLGLKEFYIIYYMR